MSTIIDPPSSMREARRGMVPTTAPAISAMREKR
jgi:hypothetical protein